MHNHSIFSDGLLSPTQLIELAARTGVDAIALTDHDTTDGLEEAARTFAPEGVVDALAFGDDRRGETRVVVGLAHLPPQGPGSTPLSVRVEF